MYALALFFVIGALWLLVRLFQSGPMWGKVLVLAVGGIIGFALLALFLFSYVQEHGWWQRWRIRQLRRQLAKGGREVRYLLAVNSLGAENVRFGSATGTDFRKIMYLVYEELPHARYSLEIWFRSGRRFVYDRSIDLAHLKRATVEGREFVASWAVGQVIELFFDNGDRPIRLLVPGSQRDTLNLPWRLQEITRRRIRISEARRQRRERRAD